MPVCAFANVHCAAASEDFIVQENHSVDLPWWDSLVDGGREASSQLAQPSDYFAPTTEWDTERSGDNLYT
ncbi:MAG: hypothetical protein EHM65_06140 [Acidobacteriales bacterium]|nr:MAG: hypothetical protein EHM65_06140 [Terriglobales bacterium]